MNSETTPLSEAFQRLYCDTAVFENFSAWHPISFARVLPFQAADLVIDDPQLLTAEVTYLTKPNSGNRLGVLEAFVQCGVLSPEDLGNLKLIVDDFGADFFDFMGETYANAGIFICALRWHREYLAVLEAQAPGVRSDAEDAYASVGYCLYALGLFAEAIAWTKSCIGPDLMEMTIGGVLTDYQAQCFGGRLLATERAVNRTRFTASTAQDAEVTRQGALQLKAAMKRFAPFQEVYFDWISADAPAPQKPAASYPFRFELDNGCLPRHKMNLLFSLCGQADELFTCGFAVQAKRLLQEASLLEPQAGFVQEKLKALS